MGERQRGAVARRSSGLLSNAPVASGGETRVLCNALKQLSVVTRAISANLRHVNTNLERILMDKQDIEELEAMLKLGFGLAEQSKFPASGSRGKYYGQSPMTETLGRLWNVA